MRNVRLPCDETSFELGITNQGPGTRFPLFRFLSLVLSVSFLVVVSGFGSGFQVLDPIFGISSFP